MRPSRSAFTFASSALLGLLTLAGSLAPLGCETAASAPVNAASDAAPDRAIPGDDAGCPIVNDAATLDCTHAVDAGDAGSCDPHKLDDDPNVRIDTSGIDASTVPVGCTIFSPMPPAPNTITSPYTCVMRQCFCGTGADGANWACGL